MKALAKSTPDPEGTPVAALFGMPRICRWLQSGDREGAVGFPKPFRLPPAVDARPQSGSRPSR